MSQRGETAFVAMRVGRIHDPREVLSLAAELKVRPVEALGYVLLWEEFILEVGDALTGRVKGYRPQDIAAKLTYDKGKPATLIRAMENAGVLRQQRSTFFHPFWLETVTGHYARQRAERREYEREKKQRQRNAHAEALAAALAAANGETFVPGDTLGTAGGQPGESLGSPTGSPDIKKERNGSGGASRPPNPPPSGGSLGEQRWEWLKQHHKRPRNPPVCIRYLEAMTAEDWALCQWVVTDARKSGAPSLSQKKRVFSMHTQKFLAEAAYLEFLPEWREKQLPREVTSLVEQIQTTDRERKDSARAFIQAQMSDPDLTDEQKQRARELWLRSHPGESLEVPN